MSEAASKNVTGRERLAQVVSGLQARFGPKAEKLAEANEAATRLLIIDDILIALGWPKESFHPETRTSDGTYMDYLITVDRSPRLVVEAKRIGNTFAPSSKKLRRTEYLLSYLRQAFGTPFTEVLRQAEEYCRDVAVPFAVLTNGAEWVVAQVLPPPGVTEERLRCYYVGNIFDESSNLDLMWELLSASAVSDFHLEESFSVLNALEAEYCAEPRSLIGELSWKTPVDQPGLSDFYHCFFDEIIDRGRRNMLEHCYVTSHKLDQYHGELKRTLIDTAPAFLDDAEELSPGDTQKILPDTSGDQKGRVVLVVGSVGAGKSTFVTKTLIENRNVPGLVFITLDLINEAVLHADSPPERLWKLLKEAWVDRYPDSLDYKKLLRAFHGEIEQLRRGPSAELFAKNPDRFEEAKAAKLEILVADPEKCLQRMWRQTAPQTRVVVFLDNVDRASEAFQHRMYAFAHAVAAETGATVIVTMRESTYYRAKDSGFLDVRTSDKVFHLQAPDVVQLISKRVSYVEHHMDQDHRAAAWRREKDWDRFRSASQLCAAALKVTFLEDNDGRRLLTVLAALAWHNIRAFLATLRRIHTLLAGVDGDGSARWTEDHVLSALLAADTSGSLRAIPATLYRPPSKRHSCFLLKLRLLFLLKVGVRQLEKQHGFGYSRMVEFARVYGYRRRWTEAGIEELVRERLLECLQIPAEVEHTSAYQLSVDHVFRLSPLGILVIEQLMYHPIYLATSAWEIPYHTKDHLDEFMLAAKDALATEDLGQCEIDAERADFLVISEVPGVVTKVLAAARSIERVLAHDLAGRPEVSAVEEKVRDALDKLGATVQAKQETPAATARVTTLKQPSQTTLPLDSPYPKCEVIKIRVPPDLDGIKIGPSSSAPAVFLALVFAHVNSLGPQSGAEITAIINSHLRDDYQQLEHTNISRLLRSPFMLSQKWLRRIGRERKWRFSLASGWREQWVEIFTSEAPG